MVGRKGKNILRAGTQAQADKILEEQEHLISRVCDEVTDGDSDCMMGDRKLFPNSLILNKACSVHLSVPPSIHNEILK